VEFNGVRTGLQKLLGGGEGFGLRRFGQVGGAAFEHATGAAQDGGHQLE
jgi:hypothetical protein